jgi:hypothetical protein
MYNKYIRYIKYIKTHKYINYQYLRYIIYIKLKTNLKKHATADGEVYVGSLNKIALLHFNCNIVMLWDSNM